MLVDQRHDLSRQSAEKLVPEDADMQEMQSIPIRAFVGYEKDALRSSRCAIGQCPADCLACFCLLASNKIHAAVKGGPPWNP